MNHIIGTPLIWTIAIYSDSSALLDADSLPTVSLRINQAESLQSVTLTKRAGAVGLYDCAASLAGIVEGDHIEALVAVEIDGEEYHHPYQWIATAPMRGTDGALTTLGSSAPTNWINAAAIASNAITAAKIANGALTSAKFAAGAFDAVWSVAGRTLTAVADSAGVGTLLDRIVGRVQTKGEADAAYAIVQDSLDNLLAIPAPDNDGIAAAQLAAETAAGLLVGRPPTVVLPSSVSVPDRRDIASVPLYLDETIVVAISIFELDEVTPVNLTDEQLEVVVEDGSGAVLVVIEPEQITIAGYNSNVVTFAAPAPVTDRVRLAPFAIRRKGGDQCVFANGQFDVRKAPRRPPSAG